MLLDRVSAELDVLGRIDSWLVASLDAKGCWHDEAVGKLHSEKIRRLRSASLSERFPNGQVNSASLAGALSDELSRLASCPALFRAVLSGCDWPSGFKEAGLRLLSEVDALSDGE